MGIHRNEEEKREKTLKKSKKVLEQRAEMVKQKFCTKKLHTFTINASNYVREQLKKQKDVQVLTTDNFA